MNIIPSLKFQPADNVISDKDTNRTPSEKRVLMPAQCRYLHSSEQPRVFSLPPHI
jgi:hypothetical protein